MDVPYLSHGIEVASPLTVMHMHLPASRSLSLEVHDLTDVEALHPATWCTLGKLQHLTRLDIDLHEQVGLLLAV